MTRLYIGNTFYDRGNMKVSEIFYSIQGEGLLAGRPSVFIRLAGCPLKCTFCDTKYAWTETGATELSVEQILIKVVMFNCCNVVITGGEPMVTADAKKRQELSDLTDALVRAEFHITIETVGKWYFPKVNCDLMSISPKLSNAIPKDADQAYKDFAKPDAAVLTQLIHNYDFQLKFVIDKPTDIDEVLDLLDEMGSVDRDNCMLMPQASTCRQLQQKGPMVADLCTKHGLVFSNRLQTILYDSKKGH